MRQPISRRTLLTGGSLSLAACGTMDGAYFGKTDPPSSQRLVYLIGSEGGSLDPGKVTGGYERLIVPALFEGLTNPHPTTAQPVAALATYYDVNADFTQYTFYLRGHPRPKGVKFANTDTLPEDFSRGRRAPADTIPARWSDGTVITAHDFVYSWRRVVDPATATPQYGYYLLSVRNARQIVAVDLPPDTLGVRALDDFTFQVDLVSPVSYFLQLTWSGILAAAPRRAIEAAKIRGEESSWTEPSQIVTSGAFMLRERRPYERTVVRRNPRYYEAGLVTLDEITFIPVADATAGLNLYRTNSVHAMTGDRLPPLFTSTVERKKDAYSAPALFHIHPFFNCRKRPFDNVLLRYAMNMATDKQEMAGVFGRGRAPAKTWVPPFNDYEPPDKIMVPIGGRYYDVLSYNPAAARELLARAGFPNSAAPDGVPLSFEYLIPNLPHSRPMAEVLQQQWRRNLNLSIRIVSQELTAYINTLVSGRFEIAEDGCGDYQDPNTFLGVWETGAPLSVGWSTPEYDAMIRRANSETLPANRLKELKRCEEYLLRAMPLVPLLFYGYAGLQKPYVRGLGTNLLDVHPFKYAWIDTNWKPERS